MEDIHKTGHLAGSVNTSEPTGNKENDAWGTAGCLLYSVHTFIPAEKAVKPLDLEYCHYMEDCGSQHALYFTTFLLI